MGTVVLGIDPSSRKFAAVWSVNDGPPKAHTYVSKDDDLNVRCLEMYRISRKLYRFLASQYPMDDIYVFMEDPVLGRGGARSTIVQAKVNGAIAAGLLNAGALKVTQVNNSAWKKRVVGKGNAGKPEIKAWAKQYWRQLFVLANNGKDQDLIDAGCIMRHGQHVVGLLERLRRQRATEARATATTRRPPPRLRRKVRR